jgi:hypothetical protein
VGKPSFDTTLSMTAVAVFDFTLQHHLCICTPNHGNMRLQIATAIALCATIATSHVLLTSSAADIFTAMTDVYASEADALLEGEPVIAATAADSKWDQAVLSGGNLWAGMHSDDRKASFLFRTDPHTHDPMIQTVQSTFDGDMKEDFKKWGYFEDPVEHAIIDKECDFATYHKIRRAFDELGIKTESKANKGPNECVQLDHRDGPNVVCNKDDKLPLLDQQKYIDASCGKEYRVSLSVPQVGPC